MLGVAALVLALQGQVWVVDKDAGPGTDFTELQPAVDAAAEGDVLLVRLPAGGATYGGYVLDGKALSIVADPPDGVFLFPTSSEPVTIRNLAPGQTVLLQGMEAKLLNLAGETPFTIEDCAGTVLLEDCVLTQSLNGAAPVVRVTGSSAVVATRTLFKGAALNAALGTAGADALFATDSTVHLYDCALTGGGGGDAGFPGGLETPAGAGGAAARVAGGFLFASGSAFRSGDGGAGSTGPALECSPGGDAGDGLVLAPGGAPPLGKVLAPIYVPGSGGASPGAGCPAGADGLATRVDAGALGTLAGAAGSFAVSSPLRAGETGTLGFGAGPGALAWLTLSGSASPLYFEALLGTIVPTGPAPLIFLGGLDGSGALNLPFVLGPPGAGDAGVTHLQALYLPLDTLAPTLGPPSALVLVDAAF